MQSGLKQGKGNKDASIWFKSILNHFPLYALFVRLQQLGLGGGVDAVIGATLLPLLPNKVIKPIRIRFFGFLISVS